MTVLVTGATGRVGSALIEALPAASAIRAATRDPASYQGRGEAVAFDFADRSTFAGALRGMERVFLMRPPKMSRGGDVAPFLDAALGAGVRRVVVLSVEGAGKIKILPHYAVEREVRERPFEWTVLRPADFMQNLETEHRRTIVDNDEIAVPAGDGAAAMIDVRDVGAVSALALTENGHAGRAYTLTGPDALTFGEVAHALSRVLCRSITYRALSVPSFIAERHRAGEAVGKILVMCALYTAQRLGKADTITGEVARLLKRPATPLQAYVEREAEVWARGQNAREEAQLPA